MAGPQVAALIAPQTGAVFIFVTAGLLYILVRRLQAGATPAPEQPQTLLKSGLTLRMVLITGMAMGTVAGMVAYSFFDQRERALLDANDRMSRIAGTAREEAIAALESARYVLLAISSAGAIRDPDPARCSAYLKEIKDGLPQFVNFGVIRPDGTLACSALPFTGRIDLSDRSYFRNALERKALAVGEYLEGRVSGRTSLIIGYPVLEADGAVTAVAFAALDLELIASHIDRVAAVGEAVSLLIDRNGRVLFRGADAGIGVAGPEAAAAVVAASREPSSQPRWLAGPDGLVRVYGFARVPPEESGLIVAVGIPVATVLAPLQAQLANTVARILVAVVIALIGSWTLGWFWVVKPASAVLRAARRVADGDFSARTGAAGFGGELGDIGRAFDEMAESLERSETRYRATFEQAALGIAHLSRDGNFLRVNRSLCEMLGYTAQELLKLDFQRISHPEDLAVGYGLVRRVLAGTESDNVVEQRCVRKDGTVLWCRLTLSMVRTPAGDPDYFITALDDISDKKWAERRIERLAAMYRTLSETNEAIVRNKSLPALQQEICDIVAKFGGFILAWVGTVDRQGGVLKVSAKAGGAVGYVEALHLPLDESVAEGRGPSVQAAVRRAHVICNDFLNDPATAPWHLPGSRYGIAASAAFPLRQGARVESVLNVYSGETGFFDTEVIELMDEMAANISFALDAMARDAERRAAEAALRRNDERLDAMLRLSEGAGSLSIEDITQRALEAGIRLSESRAGVVYLVRQDRGALKIMASIGVETAVPGMRLKLEEAGSWSECIRLGSPVFRNQPDTDAPGAVDFGLRGVRYAAIPACDLGKVVSVLLVAGRETDYREDDLRQLQLVAETLWRLTEGKRAQVKALEAEHRFRGTFEHSGVGMANVGLDGCFLRVNRRFCEMAGYSEEELLAMRFQDIVHPDDLAKDLELAIQLRNGVIPNYSLEKRYMRRDGKMLWGLLTVSAMRRADGRTEYFIAVVEDITQLKEAQERLRLDAMVFEGSREGITITDAQPRILACNRAFTQITGYEKHEVLGQNPAILQSGRQDREFYRAMWESLKTTGRWSGEIWNRRKSGEVYPEWLAISALEGPGGVPSHYIGIFSDISPQKQAEETIQRLLQYDHLTQLPNRALLRERLDLTLAHVRHRERRAAVMLLNLVRFRSINENLGHAVGDTVLKEVAARLTGALRSGDTVSRLDADNFAIVLNDMERSEDAGTLAAKLLETVGVPMRASGQDVRLTAWIGVSVFPEDGGDGEALMRSAQAALASARSNPGGGCRFSDPALNQASEERRLLAVELRGALEREELVLHYQPLVDLVSGEMTGVEALLRWNHPRLGMVLPGRFVHIAEETGLISAIGEWALAEICRQGQGWREQHEPGLRLSVNISSLQIRDGTLPDAVRRALQSSGLPAGALELEVTESYFLTRMESNRNTLQALKDLGVTFAIDDFGTHYAGLGFLRNFPVDRVKVDQSFIREIATQAGDAAICRAIISMAHGLGMKVSAEGVETEAQLRYLRMLHCDEAQGYYFSPAVAPDEVEKSFRVPSRLFDVEPAQRTLLLVDDEPNVLASLNRALRREGYRILAAGSAQEGLELLAAHDVGVILSDQRMPGMTGTEFMSRVKLMYPRVIRIVLSGHTDLATITDAINRGAVYKFLTKPWEDAALRDTLREAFERYETSQLEGGSGN